MNRLGNTLSQVLIGTLPDDGDADELRDAALGVGRSPGDVVVLSGDAGIEELFGTERPGGIPGLLVQLVRRIEALDGDGTGHILSTAEADLRAGHTVVLMRHVSRGSAAPLSDLFRRQGIDHMHYIGRWTVAEHGALPSNAA